MSTHHALFFTFSAHSKDLICMIQNGVPAEFAAPMLQWLQSQGFQALPQIMEKGMVPFGYGNITQTPVVSDSFSVIVFSQAHF